VHLGHGTLQCGVYALLVSIEVAVEVCFLLCDVSLYSVVEQRLKCNTGEVFNCLIQFLLNYGSFN
jgi:hypothetical protein